MKTVKQKKTLNIFNLDNDVSLQSDNDRKHGDLLPTSCRTILSGPSSCGKTNVMLGLLISENGLKFENIYLYAKSLFQPKYEFLREVMKPIKNIGYQEFSENDDVISPSSIKPNSVFIFDDIICDKQEKIREYFSMGRHKGVDSFYLGQTYAKIPKHLIRDNANLIILFKQDELNLKHVYRDHVVGDVSYEDFKNICRMCWKDPYDFLVINKDCSLNNGRYRKGFDTYISL